MSLKPHIIESVSRGFIFLICVLFFIPIQAQKVKLNSGWQFSTDNSFDSWETVNLPHTWNLFDAFDDEPGYRRGKGYYQNKIFISSAEQDKIHYLKFNGVNQEATVLINGKEVGNHKGGYTAFNFDITSYIQFNEHNLIEVVVDNSHDTDIPPLDADFTFYGGIYRDVERITLPKQHFSLEDFTSGGVYVNYRINNNKEASLELNVTLDNKSDENEVVSIDIELLDSENRIILQQNHSENLVSNLSKKYSYNLPSVNDPKLWSPDQPYLYKLILKLKDENGTVLDSRVENVGFRWVEVSGEEGLILNGEPIKVIGVNRHQDYEGYGNAVPIDLQKKDIHLIKEMGANIIRFAHYPHSRELYDLCDKLGLLVWSEIPIVNKVTDTPEFIGTAHKMQEEHIKQYYNHPSLVMFGYMNEIFLRLAFDNKSTDEEKENLKKASYKLATQLETLTRELAPNRITVMALHFNEVYNETKIADIPMLIGWNLYFGWYHDKIEDLGTFLDNQHQRFPERPIMISEYGPGADTRIFTSDPKKYDYSQAYQLQLHQGYYKQVMEREFVAGMTAWNFADFGSEFRADAIPHINQKGLVQYNREPKEVYYWYQSVLKKDKPFIHIATESLDGMTLFKQDDFPIDFFSNQASAEIKLNGDNLGKIQFENGSATIDFPLQNGMNTIEAWNLNVKEIKTLNVQRIQAFNFSDYNRIGINVGSHFFFNDQEHQIVWFPDQNYQQDLYGYLNGEVYNLSPEKHQGIPYNIINSTSEPMFQTMLMGCTDYKVDIPDGVYEVNLYFVEPTIKSSNNLYSLGIDETLGVEGNEREFDILLNDHIVQSRFNPAMEYPDKYGITVTAEVEVGNSSGLRIKLRPIKGEPILSGILIEKK